MVLPVEIHPIFYMNEAEQDQVLQDTLNERRLRLVAQIATAESHDLWMRNAMLPHLFSLFPSDWNATDIAVFLGEDKGRVSRFKQGKEFPPFEKIRFSLDAFESKFPTVSERIYFAHGVVSALHNVHLEITTGAITDRRRRIGIPINESTLVDTAILYALVTPPIFNTWTNLAIANSKNLEVIFDEPTFLNCLADVIHCASQLFGNRVYDTTLRDSQEALAAIDLESRESVCNLSSRIVRVWDYSTQFEMELVKSAIGSDFDM